MIRRIRQIESAKLDFIPLLLAEVSRGEAPDDELLVLEEIGIFFQIPIKFGAHRFDAISFV